jgi:hypothetical protein
MFSPSRSLSSIHQFVSDSNLVTKRVTELFMQLLSVDRAVRCCRRRAAAAPFHSVGYARHVETIAWRCTCRLYARTAAFEDEEFERQLDDLGVDMRRLGRVLVGLTYRSALCQYVTSCSRQYHNRVT